MRRFIVTEEQLEEYKHQIRLVGDELEPDLRDLWKAEADCMAIEIPDWATHFAHITTDSDGHSGHWYVLHKSQEIGEK